jgi:hypothetical protein
MDDDERQKKSDEAIAELYKNRDKQESSDDGEEISMINRRLDNLEEDVSEAYTKKQHEDADYERNKIITLVVVSSILYPIYQGWVSSKFR